VILSQEPTLWIGRLLHANVPSESPFLEFSHLVLLMLHTGRSKSWSEPSNSETGDHLMLSSWNRRVRSVISFCSMQACTAASFANAGHRPSPMCNIVGISADQVGEKGLVVQVHYYTRTQDQMWRPVWREAERASEAPVGARQKPLSRADP
jgi:hypothetical protein